MNLRKKFKLLLLIGLLLGVMSACSKEVAEDEFEVYTSGEVADEEVVLENNNLELHFVPTTTQFYVVDKNSGHTWYSNPVDAEADPKALGIQKKDILSTVSLKYNTESGTATTMTSFGSSVEKGNYSYEVIDNSITVNYTIADMERSYIIPTGVGETRFNQFFDKIDEGKKALVKSNYKIYDPAKVRKGENAEELLAMYPAYATEKVYILREGSNKQLMVMMEELFAAAGYNQTEYTADTEALQGGASKDIPMFNVTIQYTLEDDSLVVTMPMDKIKYKANYPIIELRPLAYFGAAGTTEDGYIFIPDGSGAIINYNNGKQTQNVYKADVYGWDYAKYRDSLVDESMVNLPVFGMSNSDASFLCVMEQGSAHAFLEAMVSGYLNSYNYVTSNYYMLRSALMDISAKSDKTVRRFQEELPQEDIVQRYLFIDDTDYTAMATTYREYLMEQYPELTKNTESDLPVAVELIGAVDRTKHVMGIPTRQPDELTSYKEVQAIIERLVDQGVNNLNLKYNGWFNEGILHTAPNKVKLISELGSKKDFRNLVNYADEKGVNLYLASTFQYVYNNSIKDNFMAIRDSAKFVSGEIVDLLPFSPVFYGEADWLYTYNLTKPNYYLNNIDAYADKIADLGVKNIAFNDIGETLGADYDTKKSVSREQAKNLQSAKLSELKQEGYNLMINSGNLYALPYAEFIVGLNLNSKGYNIIDEEIPFTQIALHGLVNYSGSALNLAQDYEKDLLRTVETGAGLYFTFMDADGFELQDSRYIRYFSADINDWEEDVVSLYKSMQEDFGHLYNQYIVNHEKLANGVYMTEYEDGTQVIVNYNTSAYTHNGKEVAAKNYLVEGGKQ